MTISWTAGGASAAAAPSAPWTITGATLGTGDIFLFLYAAGYAGITGDISVTINGNAATLLGSAISIGSDAAMVWTAANTGSTGNIVIASTSTFGDMAANWFVITGEGTPTLTTFEGNFAQFDPQGPVTGTIAFGGVGIVAAFGDTLSGTPLPMTWSGATSAGSTMEAYGSGGNNIACSAASVSSAGSASVEASGSTNAMNFADAALLMLAFPASGGSGGGSGLASIAIPRKVFLRPKKIFYQR